MAEVVGYTTQGSVRGSCGHVHRTERAAEACAARDERGCASQGGYSDRGVRTLTRAQARELHGWVFPAVQG